MNHNMHGLPIIALTALLLFLCGFMLQVVSDEICRSSHAKQATNRVAGYFLVATVAFMVVSVALLIIELISK